MTLTEIRDLATSVKRDEICNENGSPALELAEATLKLCELVNYLTLNNHELTNETCNKLYALRLELE